jgi:lysophospholipase L1-like esterase
VLTVVRGNTQEGSRVFTWGEESGRFSVGSRGDWTVSGPGVMPSHLWLNFDGRQLFAASGDAVAYATGKQLGNEWSAVQDGAELRFGFALLRVTCDAGRARPGAKKRARPEVLIVAIASAVLLTAVLVAALLFRSAGGATGQAALEPSARAAVPAPSFASAAQAPATPDNALTKPPPVPIAQPLLPSPSLAEPVAPPKLADSPDAQSATFKPPPAYPQNVANRPVPRIGDKPWLISEEWRAHHERHLRAPGRANAKVIFLGDSITEGWSVAPAYREHFGKYAPLNFGIANDMTQNVLWRVEHGALDGTQPQAVVLMVGINNLAGGFTAEQTADGVRALVSAIQSHASSARVFLLGVLPARQDSANPLRQGIKDANRLLQGLAKPGKVEVRDVGSVMLEPDGSISKSTMRDFVHPTPDGFARLSQATAPLLDSLLAQAN